ncbi:MAG: tripartite tricarboxylate transporter permease [Planctomycetota bacterium]|jgi:putative tricarboxylic transport membrane protein|nr:tripartite tricarboxylate transporter permease [Planctomycetota bacterium]
MFTAEVFANVFEPLTLLYLVVGVAAGIGIGCLPGLTATMGVALVLPLTFGMEAIPGILLLLGVYVGAIYGGSVSAILIRTPGTPAAAATVLDGYEFAKRGEAGRALGISTLSSFVGGMISCVILAIMAPWLARIALKFSSPEFFLLAVFGLCVIASISGASLAKGLLCGALGMILACVGIDGITAHMRYTYGNINLLSGINYIPVMIGLFAMSQAFEGVEDIFKRNAVTGAIPSVLPRRSDLLVMARVAPLCGLAGTAIGIIPGAGADIAAFVAYGQTKNLSKRPELFGTGIPEGVAAPESANNGVTGGALIPMLTLGVPGDAVAAIMIGALTVQGLQPGPLLFRNHPALINSVFMGMFLANIVMCLMGFFCIRAFVKVLSIPKAILTPAIFMLCVVGSYAMANNFFDVWTMLVFGIVGYFLNKIDIIASPAVLGLILGPMAESHFRRALLMGRGSYGVFFSTPLTWIFWGLIAFSLFLPFWQRRKGGSAGRK